MPGAGSWHAQKSVINQPEILKSNQWIMASHEDKSTYTSVKKRADAVIAIKTPTKTPKPQHQTSEQLWQNMETLLNQSEFQQLPILGTLLAEHLRKYPAPIVYQRIASLLQQPNVSDESKAILLDLLSEIATPESLNQLINLAQQGEDLPLYLLILQAISRIGDNRWDGKFHKELSPILEAAWSNPGITDQAFLNAIGKATASIGAPQGVNQLLTTLSGNNTTNDTEETNRIKQTVAFEVIPQVRNPDAVDILGAQLEKAPLGTPSFEASLNALSGIGSPKATEKILDWAKDAQADGARTLTDSLSKIDDADSLKNILAAQSLEFQNPEIKSVVNNFAAGINANTAATDFQLP